MDQTQISAIFPIEELPPRPQQPRKHTQPSKNPPLTRDDVKPCSVPNIYYGIRSMKQLLQQRSIACQHAKIQLKPSIATRARMQPQCSPEQNYEIIRQIFHDSPTRIDAISLVFISSFGTEYGFFSTDDKFVPLCMKCNMSVYVLVRRDQVKILCSNSACKTKLLAQFVPENQSNVSRVKRSQTQYSEAKSHKVVQERTLRQTKEEKKVARQFTEQQLRLIKRTARKIYES